MNDKHQTILKNILINFLEKLNNGDKLSWEDIELNYKQIQPFIDLLYTIEDFPMDDSNDDIYRFVKSEKETFDKYQIQNIVDIGKDYLTDNIKDNHKDSATTIKNYVENKSHNGKKIDLIVWDYASIKNCNDSKDIKKLIMENGTKEKTYSEKELIEEILKYATHENHCKDIADIIKNIERENIFSILIQDIIKESELPRRDDKVYQVISSYEPYELTHCISYEMAIRNKDVIALLKNIKSLTILSKRLFEYYISFGDIEIKENFYLDSKKNVTEALELLNHYEITQNFKIKFKNYKLLNMYASIMQIITHLIMILEKNYFMIYDRKEIVPEGMEDVFKESNHYEPDRELYQYMNKAIEELMKNEYDPSHRYKDNYTVKDGYVTYQASYEDSSEYDINKIFPNFKRPMREFNQTQVAFNMSLPKDEIMAYIEKIKDDYDNKNNFYKTLNQLLYGDDTRIEDKLEHKQQDRYADDFFIYDYYTQSDEVHEKKLESIQKKLSQFHGMKVENGRNNYKIIDYDEALIKLQSKSSTSSNSFTNIAKKFKESEHIIHYIETIKIIENRFEVLKKAIDDKKFKTLIHHG